MSIIGLQRDVFINVIYEAALKDPDIVFVSADFGAASLDAYRQHLPRQFIHCGIAEQHMIDMAAGLALSGKKVYCYCMGPFWLRCFEQVKCSLAMMNLPVTLLGAGVGLGYADSGPTHYVAEDLACFRSLANIEVWTAADNLTAADLAALTVESPALRYIRLDREPLPDIGKSWMTALVRGWREIFSDGGTCFVSSGYMLHRALAARAHDGMGAGVIDVMRIKPLNAALVDRLRKYERIVTVEEQSGGFHGAIAEALAGYKDAPVITRLCLEDRFYFENGGREYLLDRSGLSVKDICAA